MTKLKLKIDFFVAILLIKKAWLSPISKWDKINEIDCRLSNNFKKRFDLTADFLTVKLSLILVKVSPTLLLKQSEKIYKKKIKRIHKKCGFIKCYKIIKKYL